MEALVWLAIPFVVTVIAAVVLRVRAVRADAASRDDATRTRQLRRMERALTGQVVHPARMPQGRSTDA